MGLMKGSAGWRRFLLYLPLGADWREMIQENINEGLHVENLQARKKDPIFGWTSVFDIADTNITPGKWLFDDFDEGHLVVLGFRMDKKSVNGTTVKVLTERCIQETIRARGVDRLAKNHVKELKEAVEEELLQQQSPAMKLYELVWLIPEWSLERLAVDDEDAEEDDRARPLELYVFATSGGVLQLVQDHFKEGFDKLIYPERFIDWLLEEDLTIDQVREKVAAGWGETHQMDLFDDDDERFPDLLRGKYTEIGQDFLTWLWQSIDVAGGTYTFEPGGMGRFELWLDKKVSMTDEKQKVSLSGECPGQSPEALTTLAQGRRPTEVALGVRKEDGTEYSFTLALAGYSVAIKGAKLPGTNKQDDAAIYDRMGTVLMLSRLVRKLFRTFFDVRTSSAWAGMIVNWLEQQGFTHTEQLEGEPATSPAPAGDERQLTMGDA